LVPGLEADGEPLLCRLRRPACRFDRSIDLHQRQAGVVEKGLARSGQLDAMNAARQQLGPDLVLQIANLPAQRGLGGVEPATARCTSTRSASSGTSRCSWPRKAL